jgi:DNA-binding GntR family transcriptional regulator
MVRLVISPLSEVPVYLQVAAGLRAQIADGTLAPGEELRSEPDLAHDFGVGKATVRRALQVLRGEGLIVTRRGYRSRVREQPEPTLIELPPGVRVTARMPTPEERERFGLPAGVPVLVVAGEVFPADRYAVITE